MRYRQEVPGANQATPPFYPDAVFFLEASLMHCRNLLEFIKGGRWAVTAAEVGADPLPADLDARFKASYGKSISEAYHGLCVFLDHLSPSRISYGDEWVQHDPVRLGLALLDALDVTFARQGPDAQIQRALADGRAELQSV